MRVSFRGGQYDMATQFSKGVAEVMAARVEARKKGRQTESYYIFEPEVKQAP